MATTKPRGLRKDKRIQVTLTVGRNQDGSPKRKSFYGQTRTEAEKARDEYKLKMRMGVVADADILVKDWVETCLSLYRNKVDEAYASNDAVPYRRIQKAIGRMRVADVTEADLQKLLNELAGMSFSTLNKYLYAIKLVFGRAKKNKLIFDDPSEDLQLPKYEKGSHRSLDPWEIDCILENWDKHRGGMWAMLMLLCGLRRGEMMGLTWDCIDMTERLLRVKQVAVIQKNQTKLVERAKTTAGIRILPICTLLWDCLNSIPAEERNGYVCRDASGGCISGSAFKRGWDGFNLAMQRLLNGEDVIQQGRRISLDRKVEEAAKQGRKYVLFSVRAHDLRHTFASALYDAGVDVKTAQYYLGHADIRMTMDLYTHLSNERKQKQGGQLVSYLDGWRKNIAIYEQNGGADELQND